MKSRTFNSAICADSWEEIRQSEAGVVHRCREMYPAKGAKSEPSDVDN